MVGPSFRTNRRISNKCFARPPQTLSLAGEDEVPIYLADAASNIVSSQDHGTINSNQYLCYTSPRLVLLSLD